MLLKFGLFLCLSLPSFAIERIVALSPAINEILFALESGDKIVGNTTYCRYPAESDRITKVGGYFSPSLEKILALKPDIVIAQDNNRATAEKLEKLGIRTMVFQIDSIDSIQKAVSDMARLLGKEARGKELTRRIDKGMESLKGIVRGKKILIPIGYHTELSREIYVAGQNLYFDDIIEASGNTNALQSSRKGQPVLNLEKIIRTNPDIVIILAPLMKEKGLTKEALIAPWLKLPINAAKTGSVFVENGEYAGIPSDRVVYFIHDFNGFLRETRR